MRVTPEPGLPAPTNAADRASAQPDTSKALPPAADPSAGQSSPPPPSRRLVSLDAFRGFAILGMLLVNEKEFGPATPAHLTHAGWAGDVHFADLVFPWFLFIVGVAIPYAASRWRQQMTRRDYYFSIVRRAAILVLLGCLINSSYAKRPLFDLGVLQIIGLTYLAAALLYDALSFRLRMTVAAVCLIAHWAALRFLPVPGGAIGVFTASHNLPRYLDLTFLPQLHLGSVLALGPTTAIVLIGTLLGDFLRRDSFSRKRKVGILIAAGVGLLLAGWLWSLDLQFNKPLCTASYAVFSAGSGSLALGVFYLLIDVKRWRAWAFPLVVAGRNAVFIFVAPLLVSLHVLREWTWTTPGHPTVSLEQALKNLFRVHIGPVTGGFVYTFVYIFLWWLVLWWMYRRRIFLRA